MDINVDVWCLVSIEMTLRCIAEWTVELLEKDRVCVSCSQVSLNYTMETSIYMLTSPQFQEILTAWKNEKYVDGSHEMNKELKG